ncbi:DeoR/GlpR family DNA-binding transcription regulator [Haloglycomyces albus]|uniref:DeoR/GlpR family DNA-binding transcription regulator n=1 Tax=Haloglycomyces albus TaxID=526067 RepID=UPI00046CE368|nr:DeoR/GlpR family DNA-binding transcription regulator [Haloglycomyces albus]
MLAKQRQARILEILAEQGAIRVTELVERFGVSDMTIRRDLDYLSELGKLNKVHGGATRIDLSSASEPGFEAKQVRELEEKSAIAKRAASFVHPGQAIAISAGTTTWMMAQMIADLPGLTVVTNSVPVADVFYRQGRPDQTVILTGGIRTPSDALVGPFAIQSLRTINVDAVFLGVHGFSAESGFTTPNLMESETVSAFAHKGRKLIVLADHTKWGIIGLASIADLSAADTVITDSGIDPEALTSLKEHVTNVVVAERNQAGSD